ncbi:UDP-glucose 4-epimerase [Thozetella sp. PMI_491]|nr:UDP-glucose 4-epimerase [Thozetella sp. PMI_491]
MGKRIIVTGGSGKAGRHVIQQLLDRGYQVLNLDLVSLQGDLSKSVHTLKVDLTDAGQTYSAISSHFRLTEPFWEPVNTPPDAVIHLAGVARNMIVPDNETFRVNTIGGYNVIEASCRLGVKKIILASSVCTYGVTFAEGDIDFPSFPVDEEVDANPMDAYALSKICMEKTARSFATKFKVDIYALRIGAVIAPEEYAAAFDGYVREPGNWKVHGWSYTDARDLGKICSLGIEKDGLGFQIFNATNDEITNLTNTPDFLREQCPNTPFTRTLGEREAPMSNRKVKELLGFEEDHNWRRYYLVQDQTEASR